MVKKWTGIAEVEPGSQNARLYIKLIEEEFQELMEAWKDTNFTEIVDGAIDLKWVLDGLMLMLQVDIEKAEETVATSNFSKFTDDEAIAKGSVKGYMNSGTPAYYDRVAHEGKTLYIVRRSSDDKILKPSTYRKPDWSFLIPPKWF